MINHYLKVAWRNLVRNKTYSVINIAGLATGMIVALLIGLWIGDEISFDTYHKNYSKLARAIDNQTINGVTNTSQMVAIPLEAEFRSKYSRDFKRMALVFPNFVHTLSLGEKKISASGVWTQPDLPEMLTLNMISGNRNALNDPSSVLISQSLSVALFGNLDPMNKTVKLDNMTSLKVGGVYEDLPENTTYHDTKLFLAWDKAISTFGGGIKDAQTDWSVRNWNLLVELNDNTDFNKVNAKILTIAEAHLKGGKEAILLYPMSKWHLYSDFKNGNPAGGRIQIIWMFGIIGSIVLLLASINFMNLSTARSEKRAKEVGIRKAIGSLRFQLIIQFFTESLLIAFFSMFLAIAVVFITLPLFNQLAEKQLSFPFSNPLFWLLILTFTAFTGLISGCYPAFYLSSFSPLKVLKGVFRVGKLASLPRRVLVVVQFTASITIIIGTIIIYKQIQYAKQRPVGYTREGLIMLSMNTPEIYGASYNSLRNDLMQTGVVENMAESSTNSTEGPVKTRDFTWEGMGPNDKPLIGLVGVTHDFGNTIGWKLENGRDFSRSFVADTGSIILNEAAAKLTGFNNSIGHTIRFYGKLHEIKGVVNNMILESPYTSAQPTIFYLSYDAANVITIRIKPTSAMGDALVKIQSVFKKYNPNAPFDYKFTDEEYAKKFSDEERVGKIGALFAVLSTFICCLGLFGLASFIAEQRKKEIGVRKVLGASITNIWKMLSIDFVTLVVISCFIAIPVAWLSLNQWLQQFNYRTSIPWWIFAIAGLGAVLISLLTVSYQTIKAASAVPSKSLRSE
ncbi:ABC transporter permease [Mucilaginibacter sp.]|jgi:ABC-type antimicrobial peptide transport system permease subunit|uniref:ABC transporter permease n=1 Tax=Mucilaginibacter sp. TaxID=1882438 RepID=UPI003565F4A8